MGWPVGIVSVGLAAVVYFQSRLFAEFGLQIFYALSGMYGWWKWHTEKDKTHSLSISGISANQLIFSLFFGVVCTLLLGFFLGRYTTADWPWIDSSLAAFSLVAQVWLARKWIQNWLLWMAINLVSIGLYAVKELWFFMVLYVVLFGLAVVGWQNWKQQWKAQVLKK